MSLNKVILIPLIKKTPNVERNNEEYKNRQEHLYNPEKIKIIL